MGLQHLALNEANLLINATTVGMRSADRLLIDPRQLHLGLRVYDMVYHRDTALLQAARRRGCVAAGGWSMLLYQGALSLQRWLRRPAPLAVMRRALQAARAQHRGV
jgi:shikimate dehydrogenase